MCRCGQVRIGAAGILSSKTWHQNTSDQNKLPSTRNASHRLSEKYVLGLSTATWKFSCAMFEDRSAARKVTTGGSQKASTSSGPETVTTGTASKKIRHPRQLGPRRSTAIPQLDAKQIKWTHTSSALVSSPSNRQKQSQNMQMITVSLKPLTAFFFCERDAVTTEIFYFPLCECVGEARPATEPNKLLKRECADWAMSWQPEVLVGTSSKVFVSTVTGECVQCRAMCVRANG